MPIVSTGDGLSLGVSLVLLEIPDDAWVRQAIISALNLLTIEQNWREIGSNSPELSANIFSLILQTLLFDYEPPDMMPIGFVTQWPATTAPTKWLLCQGQSLLRSAYPDLFAVIGTVYGNVDGTHFTLPNFNDRSPMQPGTGTVTALGQMAGTLAETLLIANMPAHAHDFADGGHVHAERLGNDLAAYKTAAGAGGFAVSGAANNTAARITTDSATSNITFHSQGSNTPHANLHPVLGVNFIIYAGV